MDFKPIQESIYPQTYGIPPLLEENYVSLCNNKGKNKYQVVIIKFSNCLYPDDCVHDMKIYCSSLTSYDYFDITIKNVKYNDIKHRGYLPYAKTLCKKENCKFTS
jgi:hypothetical protein